MDINHREFKGANWISSNSSFIQYCESNIGLFSIASPLVIALSTFTTAKLSLLLALKSDSEV